MAVKRCADALLEHVESLPCLPAVLVEAMELTREPDASTAALAAVIRQDPGLTAEVLRLVNSSFYGFPRRIGTVTDAVMLLGFTAVRHLLLSAEVLNLLDVPESADFSPARFWEHAVATGLLAGEIARHTGRPQREELFVAGLLHDMGKLLEYRVLRREFVSALRLAAAEGIPFYVAEERILGLTHETVGRALADRWRLPAAVQEAIAAHHHLSSAQEKGWEVVAVHAANALSRQLTDRPTVPPPPPALPEEVWATLGIPPEGVDRLLEESQEQFAEVVALVAGWWRRIPGEDETGAAAPLPGGSSRDRAHGKNPGPFLPGRPAAG